MHVKLRLLACMLAVIMMFSIVTYAAEQTGLDYDLIKTFFRILSIIFQEC